MRQAAVGAGLDVVRTPPHGVDWTWIADGKRLAVSQPK